MKKKLLKSVALLLVIPGLLLLFSCAETEVQSTKPDSPNAQIDEGKVVANEEAAQRAIEEEAIRNAKEALELWFEPSPVSVRRGAKVLEVALT